MKPLSLLARVLPLLFIGWLYGGDVLRWGQAQSAEVAALSELPRLWLGLIGCAVALGGAVVLVLSRSRPPSWPSLRLLTIAIGSLLFLDFVVLNSRRSPLSSDEQSLLAARFFAESANNEAGAEAVPRDPALLTSFLKGMGSVPFFVKGERVAAWKLEVRERCAGPASEPGQAAPGTLVYCVSNDRKQAWVTVVGTPQGQLFGPRAIVSTQDGWVGEVHVASPPEAEPAPGEAPAEGAPVWGVPTPVDP